jgi:hypothetical protein
LAKEEKRVPVTTRALVQRINRRIAGDDEVLKAARGDKARQEVGDYYIVDSRIGALVHRDVDLEAYAREIGVLQKHERLSE